MYMVIFAMSKLDIITSIYRKRKQKFDIFCAIGGKMKIINKIFKKKLKNYYCDGLCEKCKKGKFYKDSYLGHYTCDKEKIKGLHVIAPRPLDESD